MVKKLLKYEFTSFAKTILPMELILLCIAFFTRIVQFFESDTTAFKIFMYSSSILLGIAMIVCIIMTIVVCIVRFYRNLFTSEGYLTLTLPVTHDSHIIAKLITSVCASVASVISVVIALAIATAGDVLNEGIKAFNFIIKKTAGYLGSNFWIYAIEIAVAIILFTVSKYLLFFACATVGQMAKKNRVLASFGAYFAYYVIKQIIGTLVIIVFVTIQNKHFFLKIKDWFIANPTPAFHILFCFLILLFAVLSVVYYIITRYIMKHKLNIE